MNVTTYNKVEKTGTREVRKPVQVEKTVQVAVYTPVPVAWSWTDAVLTPALPR